MNDTLTLSEAIERIQTLSPSLKTVVDALLIEWQPDEPPPTIVLSSIGRHLTSRTTDLDERENLEIWDCVEYLLEHGDEVVKDSVATGLLEAVLSASSANSFDFRSIAGYLGERSKAYCQAWDRFTGCSTPGLE